MSEVQLVDGQTRLCGVRGSIDREVPTGLQVHLILDNYATHNHPDVRKWLAERPAFSCTSPRPPAHG